MGDLDSNTKCAERSSTIVNENNIELEGWG